MFLDGGPANFFSGSFASHRPFPESVHRFSRWCVPIHLKKPIPEWLNTQHDPSPHFSQGEPWVSTFSFGIKLLEKAVTSIQIDSESFSAFAPIWLRISGNPTTTHSWYQAPLCFALRLPNLLCQLDAIYPILVRSPL